MARASLAKLRNDNLSNAELVGLQNGFDATLYGVYKTMDDVRHSICYLERALEKS